MAIMTKKTGMCLIARATKKKELKKNWAHYMKGMQNQKAKLTILKIKATL